MSDQPKRLYATKNLVKKMKEATTACYKKAFEKTKKRFAKELKQNEDYSGAMDNELQHLFRTKEPYRTYLDSTYRELVCKLPTRSLEAILLLHKKDKFRRAQPTLQSIADELLARTVLTISSNKKEQSDIISKQES